MLTNEVCNTSLLIITSGVIYNESSKLFQHKAQARRKLDQLLCS